MGRLPRLMLLAALALSSMVAAPALSSSYLQCVPFARAESGVELFGNARDWWAQAGGRYVRGQSPRVGAVMAFAPTRAMPIGHVAVVSRIVSDREILLSHSNWSPINGRRGQIERNVRALDVSAAGDWSSVRVWYAPIRDLGLRANPIRGFIYPNAAANAAPAAGSLAFVPDADGALSRIVASVGN
ncbi:MAG: CHAP domain-containing protein [Sphingopyxis sp.]